MGSVHQLQQPLHILFFISSQKVNSHLTEISSNILTKQYSRYIDKMLQYKDSIYIYIQSTLVIAARVITAKLVNGKK